MKPAETVARASHVLLDFDGPVCAVFGAASDRAVADELRSRGAARGVAFPAEALETSDPFDVLKHAAGVDGKTAAQLEKLLRECEVAAVETAPATPGTPELLRRIAADGKAVTIVSNNSTAAVRRYLQRSGLDDLVRRVSARDDAEVQHLKPSPHLLQRAISAGGGPPGAYVMIGDSASDIEAARAAGTAVIAFANKPGKHERFTALAPDGIVTSMADL
ncbi:HAD-IA family hydrolase [Amycolatopsis sp. NPDC004079]|uniref:HAD family hydrolase n=1 Tax=Amycolatopsis sp. NPDC004079 TaxID=3154549 RepID=UPI0033BB2AD5